MNFFFQLYNINFTLSVYFIDINIVELPIKNNTNKLIHIS